MPEATVNDCAALNRNQPGACAADGTPARPQKVAEMP
ncbi:hypothetical protein HD593_010669 [Nonomuraea rubra]|uniref:Uncharacterized protein n=1 Tax=Nonomuraea rubra TaxID=46180 RepID=A0A7X0P6D1_9ACTN|nr:hypothetical protein [Nonomuraea rubra]